ncbi:MAG: DNA replication/repair protein RecF, partial [Treponema sp.]|nr:DNA replication/repair protein RecF [Treponema sp.]
KKNKKLITLDGKKITDRKDLLETVPVVIFCYEDMEFVSGGQERRRWFFDQTQSLYDPIYLDDLRKYRRVLKTRNVVLKDAKNSGNFQNASKILDVLDPQLSEYGIRLMEKRDRAAKSFSVVFSQLYQEVSGITGIVVNYVPSWKTVGTIYNAETIAAVVQVLAERRSADLTNGITLSGPHRDRYLFLRNEKPEEFSGNASTGQRRLLALLLRIAQARCFSYFTGKTPVLLLDDVLLELDGEKRRRFLSVMPAYEQAFFTFLPEEPYKNYCNPDTLVYYVKAGTIRRGV